jgi:hypothetical protein
LGRVTSNVGEVNSVGTIDMNGNPFQHIYSIFISGIAGTTKDTSFSLLLDDKRIATFGKLIC